MLRETPVFAKAPLLSFSVFFFNDTATTEIYTLSLHDALPISADIRVTIETSLLWGLIGLGLIALVLIRPHSRDRKSTRLNSSHQIISYAVFCLKKKNLLSQSYPHYAWHK